MNSTLKRMSLAALATLVLAEAPAYAAGDIRLVNDSSQPVHPYFKSNCWAQNLIDQQPGTWVFFGGVGPHSQFNWNNFYELLDPKCKNPVVKVTYALDGEAAPLETVVERTVLIQYDPTENHRIVLGDRVVVVEDATE